MRKEKVFTISMFLLLSIILSVGCNTNKVENLETLNEESPNEITSDNNIEVISIPTDPIITGVITELSANNELLVVEDVKEDYQVMRVSFKNDVEVINSLGEEIAYLDLKVGMKISCFGGGKIKDSYPQQASCEKIVVDESYEIAWLFNEIGFTEAVSLYGSSNLSTGYPLIGMAVNYEFEVAFENASEYKISFEMVSDQANVFFDKSGDELKPACYEGNLNIYTYKDGEIKENPYHLNHVVLQKDFTPDFIETDEGLAFIFPTVTDQELQETVLILNEEGMLSTSGVLEKVTYKNEHYNYSIVGDSLTKEYYIVKKSGKELAILPNEFIKVLEEDNSRIDDIQIEHYTNNLTLVYEGELLVYNHQEKLWRKIDIDGNVKFANYYSDTGTYSIFVENASGMEYTYDWKEDKVNTRIRIGSSYMNEGIKWDGSIYINYVYQVGEDIEPIVFLDQDFNQATLDVSIEGNDYQIIDSFVYEGTTYIIDAKDNNVKDVESGLVVLDVPVGNYSYSDGILAYINKDTSHWYYFNFSTMENNLLSQVELPIVKVHHGEIGTVDFEGNFRIISTETGDEVEGFYITEVIKGLIEGDVLFDFDKDRIYINMGTTYVVDREDLSVVDHFVTRDIHVSKSGRFFYTALGGLFEYNADNKTHRAIAINEYCVYLNTYEDKIIVYHGIDGPGTYGVFDMDESWYETSAGEGVEGYDYALFYNSNEYGSRLYVLDHIQERIYLLTWSNGMINYSVEEDKILYQPLNRGLYGEKQEPKGELMTFELSEGASVYVYDSNVMRYYQDFMRNVEEGYVNENEFYKFDEGKILVMTNPIYNIGLFNEKTLSVYIHGAHQKGYTLILEGYKLSTEANVYQVELNESRDMLFIAYEEDGEKHGSYFEISINTFRLRHKESINFSTFNNEDEALEYLREKIN